MDDAMDRWAKPQGRYNHEAANLLLRCLRCQMSNEIGTKVDATVVAQNIDFDWKINETGSQSP